MKKIQKTSDYDIFKTYDKNRKVVESHVNRLAKSISKKNMLACMPIIVNAEMEVLDGQHRLQAAKILGEPIYYIVDDDADDESIISMNTVVRSWTVENYLDYWIMKGKKPYQRVKTLCNNLDVSINLVMRYITNRTSNQVAIFKNGEFDITDREERLIECLVDCRLFLMDLYELRVITKTCMRQVSLNDALRSLYMRDKTIFKEFTVSAMKNKGLWHKQGTVKQYIDMFESIYNYKRKKSRCRFLHDNGNNLSIIQMDGDK